MCEHPPPFSPFLVDLPPFSFENPGILWRAEGVRHCIYGEGAYLQAQQVWPHLRIFFRGSFPLNTKLLVGRLPKPLCRKDDCQPYMAKRKRPIILRAGNSRRTQPNQAENDPAQTKRIGAYLRKMAIDGYIIYVDTRDIKEMNKLPVRHWTEHQPDRQTGQRRRSHLSGRHGGNPGKAGSDISWLQRHASY